MVASRGFYEWVAASRPYTLIRPATAIVANLRRHGLVVYHYPNDDHLKASTPQDHTPYSVTGWPGGNRRWLARGVDVMPRDDSAAARKENADIARQLIKDRNAGHPGAMWIKYINWTDEGGVCRQERWTPNHTTLSSTDRGHIHISGRSDVDDDDRADTYDPIARMNGTDEDMDSNQVQQLTNVHDWLKNYLQGNVTGTWPHSNGVLPRMVPNEKLNKIDQATTGLAAGGITQEMVTAGLKDALKDPEVLAALRPLLVDAAAEGAEKAEDS
jgi:hypothetical protein